MVGRIHLVGTIVDVDSCQKLLTGGVGLELGLGVSGRIHRGMTHGENGFDIGMKGFGRAEKIGLVGRFEFNKGSVIS